MIWQFVIGKIEQNAVNVLNSRRHGEGRIGTAIGSGYDASESLQKLWKIAISNRIQWKANRILQF
jgi:hypothetical protein